MHHNKNIIKVLVIIFSLSLSATTAQCVVIPQSSAENKPAQKLAPHYTYELTGAEAPQLVVLNNNLNVPVTVDLIYQKNGLGKTGIYVDKNSSTSVPLPKVSWFEKMGKGFRTEKSGIHQATDVLMNNKANQVIFHIPNSDSVSVLLNTDFVGYEVTLAKEESSTKIGTDASSNIVTVRNIAF